MASDIKLAVLLLTATPPGAKAGEGAFTRVDGRECLLRSAEMFVNREEVAQVLTCFTKDEAEEAKRRFGGHLAFSGVKLGEPADGWAGQIASLAGKVSEEVSHVLIHDAARPVVPFTDLDALAEAVAAHPQQPHALALEPSAELVETDGQGRPVGYRPADAFRLLIWPRVYAKGMLPALTEGREPEAGMLRLVEASPLNVRCDGPKQAKLVQAMLKLRPEPKREGPLSPFDEAQW